MAGCALLLNVSRQAGGYAAKYRLAMRCCRLFTDSLGDKYWLVTRCCSLPADRLAAVDCAVLLSVAVEC